MPNVPSIFVLTALAALIAVGGFLVVNRVIKPIDLEEHQGFLDAMLNIVGTLVSILLGLLVAAALAQYQSLEQSVDLEAASVAQIFRLTAGLPDDIQKRIRHLCIEYCDLVINDEWPAMAHGRVSEKVFLTSAQIVAEVARFHPSNDGESNIHSALITAVQQVGDARRQRILSLNSPWIRHLMPMLLICASIVLTFAYLYVRKGAILHGVLICFVAVALGGNLGLVFLLSSPFSGDWKIQPRGFELNRQMLQRFQTVPEFQKILGPLND